MLVSLICYIQGMWELTSNGVYLLGDEPLSPYGNTCSTTWYFFLILSKIKLLIMGSQSFIC